MPSSTDRVHERRVARQAERDQQTTEQYRRAEMRAAKCQYGFADAMRCRLSVHALRNHRAAAALAAMIADAQRSRR